MKRNKRKYKNNYVYLIVNIYDYFPRKYIGTRSTNLEPINDIEHIYTSSSSDDYFLLEQKEYPERFEYYVLENFKTREEAIQLEINLHALYYVKNNDSYYNKVNQTSTGFDTTGMKFPTISESNRNRIITNETRKKMSEAHKGKEWNYKKHGKLNPNYGKKTSNEIIEKIRKSLKGKPKTAEHRKKMSEAHKGKKNNIGKKWFHNSEGKNIMCSPNDERLKTGNWVRGRKKMERTKKG